jgi:hypothetical protein
MNSPLILLPSAMAGEAVQPLTGAYRRAFSRAVELRVLTAFLTDWNADLHLNSRCRLFVMIVGGSFGLTRLAAIGKLQNWAEAQGPITADSLYGFTLRETFHPKVLLWREATGKCFALIGSSNLTKAAFDSNVEANALVSLTEAAYAAAIRWVDQLLKSSKPMPDWLQAYAEGDPPPKRPRRKLKVTSSGKDWELVLPHKGAEREGRTFFEHLVRRKAARTNFDNEAKRQILQRLRAAAGRPDSPPGSPDQLALYQFLVDVWLGHKDRRMGGIQSVIKGKATDHQRMARAFINVVDAARADRDAEVALQLGRLQLVKPPVATRGALFTELLCHFFPADYPVLDAPVKAWRSGTGFDHRVGGHQGERYVRLAKALRSALGQRPDLKAAGLVDLSDLDVLLWFINPPKTVSSPVKQTVDS